jgi:hypothetical protein
MPIFDHQLEDTVKKATVAILNAQVELLKRGVPTEIAQIDFQVEMIREGEDSSIQLKSVSATPRRVSISESPDIVEESVQESGARKSVTSESSNSSTTQSASEQSVQTTQHGRETQVEVEYKE